MDIFEHDSVIEANKPLAKAMFDAVEELQDHPHVAEVRQQGMILAIEMVADKASKSPYPWQERRGLTVYRHGLQHGVLLRPLGNVVYFMPPYVITQDQIQHMARVAIEGIHLATQ
ncbi:aminotransferase class III-fold pyridoxal phosphate-dependent enzyme [Kaarinaea lacus]